MEELKIKIWPQSTHLFTYIIFWLLLVSVCVHIEFQEAHPTMYLHVLASVDPLAHLLSFMCRVKLAADVETKISVFCG